MSRSFTCAICKGVFTIEDDSWTEAKAEEEMKQNFGSEMTLEECDSVCDTCYEALLPDMQEEARRQQDLRN
jgi:hypothetical protein